MYKPKKFLINLADGSELHTLRAQLFTEFDKAGKASIQSLVISGGQSPSIVVNYCGDLSEEQKKFKERHASVECA